MKSKFTFTPFYLLFLFTLFSINCTQAQTPESCNCKVDTLGLKSYVNTLTLTENNPLKYEVQNASSTFAVLHGVIGSTTPSITQAFIDSYPNVTTLVMMQVSGSEDDTANLQAAQMLKTRGYTTYLPAVNAYTQDAFIASGGTDMILAGNRRVIDEGAEVGVHSWSDGVYEATDFPVGHPFHQPYIDYYIAMGFSVLEAETFYYFTINAASSNDIHFMTEAEIEQYKLRTCKYEENPTYTATLFDNTLTADLENASYQWIDCDNGNSPINGETNQSYIPTTNGNYAVEVTEPNCNGTSICYSITTLSISENEFDNLVSLFPNPSDSDFSIDLRAVNKNTIIQIWSIDGKLLQKITSVGNEIVSFRNNKLTKGLYIIIVNTDSQKKTMKLIIK